MKKVIGLMALFILWGCVVTTAPLNAGKTRIVYTSRGCANRNVACPAWQGISRPGDSPTGPVFWFESFSGEACLIDASLFHRALPLHKKIYTCETRWRKIH